MSAIIEGGDAPRGILTVLAIPYSSTDLIFLPLPGTMGTHSWDPIAPAMAPVNQDEEKAAGIVDIPATQEELLPENFEQKSSLKSWWKRRRHNRYDRESAADKFIKRVPVDDKLIEMKIIHPASISSEEIMAILTHQLSKANTRRATKVIGYTAALPFALLLDVVTFAWVFTISDLALIYKNSTQLHCGDKIAELVTSGQIQFGSSDELDVYFRQIKESKYGLPTDDMISSLAMKFGALTLAKTVRKMRNATAAKLKIKIEKIEQETIVVDAEPLMMIEEAGVMNNETNQMVVDWEEEQNHDEMMFNNHYNNNQRKSLLTY